MLLLVFKLLFQLLLLNLSYLVVLVEIFFNRFVSLHLILFLMDIRLESELFIVNGFILTVFFWSLSCLLGNWFLLLQVRYTHIIFHFVQLLVIKSLMDLLRMNELHWFLLLYKLFRILAYLWCILQSLLLFNLIQFHL